LFNACIFPDCPSYNNFLNICGEEVEGLMIMVTCVHI